MPTEVLEKPEILAADEYSEKRLRQAFSKSGLKAGRHGWRAIRRMETHFQRGVRPLVVACKSACTDRDKINALRRLKAAAYLVFHGDLPPQAVADRVAWLGVRNEKRVCVIEAKEEERFVKSYLLALDSKDCEGRIVDAWWEEDTLVVVSPRIDGFAKLRVPLAKLPALQSDKGGKALKDFEIDEDGAFVYWPGLDVHLSWEQFEQAVDERASLKARQQSDKFNEAYGLAIRKLRRRSALRQSDIEDLTPRQVGRIERGECRATHNALTKLAKAHNMSTSDYMNELANLLKS